MYGLMKGTVLEGVAFLLFFGSGIPSAGGEKNELLLFLNLKPICYFIFVCFSLYDSNEASL